jgi:ceramide glucosyltransferase
MRLVLASLWLWLALAFFNQLAAFVSLHLLLRRKVPAPRGRLPTCTFLRPLHRVDPSKEANLDALCGFGVPVVAGVKDVEEPAFQLARRIQVRHPEVDLSIQAGGGPPGANPKVSNLIQMLPRARGEVLIFTDADVRLAPGSLEAILAPFEDRSVGLVTCPYRAVAGESLVERLDVLSNNTIFLPSVALAERLEGVRFALGACIAVRREALERIGGLHFLLDLLPDDYALASAVRRAGYRVALARVLLDHCVVSRSFTVMARRHLRWARTVYCVRPVAHCLSATFHGLPPALGLALLGGTWSWLPLLVWSLARLVSVASLRRRLALTARDLLLLPLADGWTFLVLALSLLRPSVWWDDRRLVLGRGGVILSVEEAARGLGARPALARGVVGALLGMVQPRNDRRRSIARRLRSRTRRVAAGRRRHAASASSVAGQESEFP